MLKSSWFVKIKKFYDEGTWTITMVRNAVAKGKINASEYEEITGKKY